MAQSVSASVSPSGSASPAMRSRRRRAARCARARRGRDRSSAGRTVVALLESDGDFALELTIFEDGVPPEFRAFAFREREPDRPGGRGARGDRLTRLRESRRSHRLRAARRLPARRPDRLRAALVRRRGRRARARRTSIASRSRPTRIASTLDARPARARRESSIESAGPATIRERVVLNGRIVAERGRARARDAALPGRRALGPQASRRHGREGRSARGDREQREPASLRAARAARRHGDRQGRHAGRVRLDGPHDLTRSRISARVWVDLDVYRRDFGRLRDGPARCASTPATDRTPVETTLSYLSPIGSANTQTLLARVVLPNPDRSLASRVCS